MKQTGNIIFTAVIQQYNGYLGIKSTESYNYPFVLDKLTSLHHA